MCIQFDVVHLLTVSSNPLVPWSLCVESRDSKLWFEDSSNNKTLKCSITRKGFNGMPLHVMEQPPRLFALAYRVSDFRYRNILDVPQVRTTTYGKRSFRFAAASLWNSLPDHFRTESSFAHFRSLVQSWTGSDCRCSACK